MEKEIDFLRAVKSVERQGFCSLFEAGENVYHGEPVKGVTWNMIAAETAKYLPGLVFVSSHGGISWVNGQGGSRAVWVPSGQWRDMEPARDVIRELLGGVYAVRMATPGKAAALLLKYAADPQPDANGSELLLSGIQYGYHDCKPGVYENATQWDVSGYYYSMLERADSLRVYPHKRGLQWGGMRETERENWANVKAAIKDVKILRNAMVGVMAGSRDKYTAFTRTKNGSRVVYIPGQIGPFRNLAILIVRTGWELCRSESLHTNSVYSTIDCVTSCSSVPVVWERFGFKVGARYTGTADIRGRGVYKIGYRETKWYTVAVKRSKEYLMGEGFVPPANGVKRYYTLDWLSPEGGLYGVQNALSGTD